MPGRVERRMKFDPTGLRNTLERDYNIIKVHAYGYTSSNSPVNRENKRRLLHWKLVLECKHRQDGRKTCVHMSTYPDNKVQVGENEGKPTIMTINEHREVFLSDKQVPQQTTFTLSLRGGERSARDLFGLIDENEYDRYCYSPEGGGCLYWVKCILSDMIAKKWFETSAAVKNDLEKLDSFKKDELIGEDYYIANDRGTFEKKHSPPNLMSYT